MRAARCSALLAALCAIAPCAARAQATPREELPVRLSQRPLLLPAGVVRGDHGAYIALGQFATLHGLLPSGAGVGISRDVEAGFLVPVPSEPAIYVRTRIAAGRYVDLAIEGAVRLPVWPRSLADVAVSMPLRLRPLSWLRLDVAVRLDTFVTGPSPARASFPVTLLASPTPLFSCGFQGSVAREQLTGWVGDVGTFLALSAGSDRGAARIDARISCSIHGLGQYPFGSSFACALNFSFFTAPLWR